MRGQAGAAGVRGDRVPLGAALATLGQRADEAREAMDSPACDDRMLARTYAQFRFVNPVVSGWRGMYRRLIRPLLSPRHPLSLLDVGSGGGDVSRSLAAWAARDGLRLKVIGIDPDERAHAYASGLPKVPGLRFRRALSSDLVAEGARFDFVVSNHVLHHLTPGELGGLLFDSEQLCTGRVLHADIARSRFAYLGFGLATWPFFHGSFIRDDGLISIRRSYTPAELQAVLPPRWWVEAAVPSRLVLRWDAPAVSAGAASAGAGAGAVTDA